MEKKNVLISAKKKHFTAIPNKNSSKLETEWNSLTPIKDLIKDAAKQHSERWKTEQFPLMRILFLITFYSTLHGGSSQCNQEIDETI
jgi:hypothetical protein